MIPSIPGLTTHAIPDTARHDVVYGLAAAQGVIYLSVSNEVSPGVCAFVSAFDTRTREFRKVIDVAAVTGYQPESRRMPHSKIHLSINATPDGRVFAATHFTAPAVGQTSFNQMAAYRGLYEGSWLIEYDACQDRVVSHGCLLPGEGCRISALDPVRECFYLVSYPRNHLFEYQYATHRLRDLGRIGQENPFGIEVAPGGDVYLTDDLGRFLRYSPGAGALEELDLFVPLKPGRRRQGNYVRRATLGMDGAIYGAGNKGVRLFRLRPGAGELTDFGAIYGHEAKVDYEFPRLPPAKAIVQTDANTLYLAMGGDGVYIDDIQVPSLVRYDLRLAEATEVGRFLTGDGVPAWIPQCAVYEPAENAIYFGMQQLVGELRLWRVLLSGNEMPAPFSGGLLEAHQRKAAQQPFGASVQGSDDLPFAPANRLRMTELGWRGEGLVVPPGESAIGALSFAGGVLYGVTKGRRAHLFRYAPYQQNRFLENYDVHVCDLAVLSNEPVSAARFLSHRHIALELDNGRQVELIAYDPALEPAHYRPHYHSIPHWKPWFEGISPFKKLAHVSTSRFNVGCAVFDESTGKIWSIDAERALSSLDFTTSIHCCPYSLALLKPGVLFAVLNSGHAAIIDLHALTTDMHDSLPHAVTFSCPPASNGEWLVFGTVKGELLVWNIYSRRFMSPIPLPFRAPVRALTIDGSGAVYGFAGADNEIGEAFSAQLASGRVRRIGILQIPSGPRYWECHRCDAVCAGPGGEIWFGESGRISHLFCYHPGAVVDDNCAEPAE